MPTAFTKSERNTLDKLAETRLQHSDQAGADKMTLSYESQALVARKACGTIWPRIVQLRAELHTWESVHGYFAAIRIDAERHLVQITKLPRSATVPGPKKEKEMLLEKVVKLSPKQKERLILALEGKG